MTRYTIILLSLFFYSLNAQDNTVKVSSEIKAVTVFQQGAQVTRSGSAQVPSGNATLVFSGLPNAMDPNSIQLTGNGDLTILSISHKTDFLKEEDKSDAMLKLETEMEKLDRRLEEITAEGYGLILEREILEANRDLGGTEGFTLEELRATANFAKERREQNAKAWYKLENEKKLINERKQKLQNELNQDRKAFAAKPGKIMISVEASRSQNVRFDLTYIVNAVSWNSTYDVRVDELTKPINLTHKAQIYQQTGEDWNNVKLTLATGNPSLGAQVPYMNVWYVNFNNVDYGSAGNRPMLSNADKRGERKNFRFGSDDVSLENQQFQVSQNLTQQEYNIERLQTIASKNSPVTVVLRKLDMPAKYEYHAKPRLDKDAFLVAKVYDWSKYDLLDGEISLFNNKTYVGKAYLNTNTPDDTLQLSLGRDKGVVVTRERVYSKQEKTFFGNKKIDYYTWKVDLRNNKKAAIKIVLRDQVPVSQHEDIEVEVKSVGGGKYDEKTGIIKWQLDLTPGQSKSYSISYSVKYPKDSSAGVRYY